MFSEWVTVGVAFGIKAFFALFVFALCAGVALGLMALLARILGGAEDDEE